MAPGNVVGVAAEILGRELPVARHDPFMGRDDLDPALAPVDKGVEIPRHLAEIIAQRRRLGIEGGEPQPLVIVELRHRREAPAVAVELVMIGLLQIRHAGQPAVIAVGPAVIGAGEARGVAAVGAAQPVAAMPADIEKGVHLAAGVAHDQHRVLAHVGGEEIAGPRDLAVVAQEQPAARENLPQLLLVNLRLDEDPPADQPAFGIDQLFNVRRDSRRHFGCSVLAWRASWPMGAAARRNPGVRRAECIPKPPPIGAQ